MLKLGCQVSIAGKIYSSVERAKTLGCNTMQIFARNPRQWRKTSLSEEDVKIFREKVKREKIYPVVVHVPYTLNLAATKQSFYKITIREFIADLIEADRLGAAYLITHMGSYKGSTEEMGLTKITNALKKVLRATKGVRTMVLLENTSGSGRWVGHTFSHQRCILEGMSWPERIGVCLDTAHAWAAGYKINDNDGVASLVEEVDRQIGINRLKVVHLNDTQEQLGSRRDRHFDIGKGSIGMRGFSCILNHPSLKNVPFILETPKQNDEDDRRNLNTVKRLYHDELHKRDR
ncbi:MAG: deoxyribonuclease IV [Candidatus Omnitrophota bacterium]|nr:MAG: deoxyribonuclease IV [Candidatus Omnitrophota bacterium]